MNEHTYPSKYPPGVHWATDMAWEILDQLRPGAISDDTRFVLAGMIAGSLMAVKRESKNENAPV